MIKEKMVVIEGDPNKNRDAGKAYLVKEMPVLQAEKWALRAFLAMAQSGVDVPKEVSNAGWAGLAMAGLQTMMQIQFDQAEPLLDEMMVCISRIPNLANTEIVRKLDIEGQRDIEEISTLFRLRMEVLELHAGFTFAELASIMTSSSATQSA